MKKTNKGQPKEEACDTEKKLEETLVKAIRTFDMFMAQFTRLIKDAAETPADANAIIGKILLDEYDKAAHFIITGEDLWKV